MILIAGATGSVGGQVAMRLLADGKPVRALVRGTSSHDDLERAGAEIAIGDLKDRASLEAACRGARTVISTATASARGGADTIESVDRDGTRALIDAAREAGVDQFVYVSAYGFTSDSPMPLARAKAGNERYLRESGLSYTILQPVLFMESWIGWVLGSQLHDGQTLTIVGDGRKRHGFVSARNVAELAVAVVGHPDARNAVIPLNGPASLNFREVIAIMGRVLRHEIEVQSVEPGEPVPGLPPFLSGLWALLESGAELDMDSAAVARTYGLELMSVEAFVQRTFGVGA